jgi:asparagine synthetase B (glutamine-hydrolysing)
LVFATELKAVVAHPAVECRLDDRGLADLLAFGFILGQKTLAQGVECLPGGARLHFSLATGELKIDRVWDFREQLGRGTADDVAHLDRVNDCFRDAIERRCMGNASLGVSLSGGYDSRTIMAAIDHRRHGVQTLTLDVHGADQMIAQQIAAATILSITTLSRTAAFSPAGRLPVRWSGSATACSTTGVRDDVDVLPRSGWGRRVRGTLVSWPVCKAYERNRHVRACRTQPD